MAKRRMSTFERLKTGRMNRAERRDLGRRVAASDPKLAIVHVNAGGIDVGNESHFAAVPPDRDTVSLRSMRSDQSGCQFAERITLGPGNFPWSCARVCASGNDLH